MANNTANDHVIVVRATTGLTIWPRRRSWFEGNRRAGFRCQERLDGACEELKKIIFLSLRIIDLAKNSRQIFAFKDLFVKYS